MIGCWFAGVGVLLIVEHMLLSLIFRRKYHVRLLEIVFDGLVVSIWMGILVSEHVSDGFRSIYIIYIICRLRLFDRLVGGSRGLYS